MGSADEMPQLISADAAHYNEAFKVFLDGNSMQEAKLELVKKHVPSALLRAGPRKTREGPSSVLGIGSSKGDIDISILEAIADNQLASGKAEKATIYNRVVEPNSKAIAAFNDVADEWKKTSKAEVSFDWVQATFQEYQAKKHEQNQFQFIHFIGSIYYVDPEDAIRHCLEKELAKNGVLMVACLADNSFLARYKLKFHDTGLAPFPPGYVHFTSNYIREIVKKNNWNHEYFEANWYQDISVLNDPTSRKSKMLIDFTTHTLNFEKIRGKEVAEKVRNFMIELSQSKPDGKRIIDVNKYGVVLIYPS